MCMSLQRSMCVCFWSLTQWHSTDCLVCGCVYARAWNQVAPSTTHADIVFNTLPPRLLPGRVCLNKEDRQTRKQPGKNAAFALLSSGKTSIHSFYLSTCLHAYFIVNNYVWYSKNRYLKKKSIYLLLKMWKCVWPQSACVSNVCVLS